MRSLMDPGPTLFTLKNLDCLCNFIFEIGSTQITGHVHAVFLGTKPYKYPSFFYLALFNYRIRIRSRIRNKLISDWQVDTDQETFLL